MAATVDTPGRVDPPLTRAISRNMLLLFVIGDMLGAGIYALVGQVGGRVGGAIWVSFAVAMALALFTAFAYAELVTKYPQAAGAALYVNKAFHLSFVTFMVAFAVMLSGITSASTLARAFGGDYLEVFVTVPTVAVAFAFIAVVALVNFRGIGESVKLNILFTVIEVAGLLLILVIGIAALADGVGDPSRAFEFKGGESVPLAILGGAGLAFFALIGFEDSVNVAEETQDPERNYPRALFGGLLTAGLIYIAVSMVASMVMPTAKLAESSGPLLEVADQGPLAINPKVFAAVALVAVANTALINMIMASRLVYGMSREGIVPRLLGRVHSERRTPWVAIIFTSLIAVLLISTGDLATLADMTVLLLLLVFTGVNIAVLVLRRDTVEHDHFHAPTAIPAIGAVVSLALMTTKDPEIFLRAGALLLLGAVLWLVNRALTGGGPAPTDTGAWKAVGRPD